MPIFQKSFDKYVACPEDRLAIRRGFFFDIVQGSSGEQAAGRCTSNLPTKNLPAKIR